MEWGITEEQLDDIVCSDMVFDAWELSDAPCYRAYSLLDSLDLGTDLAGPNAVGGLEFIQGPCPGNNYTAVHARDEITLSLLQQRLNDLGTGIRVVTGYTL